MIFQISKCNRSDWSKFNFILLPKKEILVCVKYLEKGVEKRFLLKSDACFAEVISRFTEIVPENDNADYCIYQLSDPPTLNPFSPVTRICDRATIVKGMVSA